MDKLYEFYHKKLSETPLEFTRYKYREIKWQGRMLGVVGPRGVGKTTMLLQRIKREEDINDTLYVSADHLYFADHSLLDVADSFSKSGKRNLYIDEIHKYHGWSQELKQIYDSYSDLRVVFTGSSILDICKGISDLSRRSPIYEMQGLSFREYLLLFHNIEVQTYTLEEILNHKVIIPGVKHPLPLFKSYLQSGYYPFSSDPDFDIELQQIITQTMEVDIPQYAGMNVSIGHKLKQLLVFIAKSVPFKPVYQKLATVINTSRNNIPDYLYYMERAGMIASLQDHTGGIRGLGKTEKLYLDNPNLIYALSPQNAETGNVRETFFLNQMRVRYPITSSSISDFQIDGKTFEVGGKNKGQRQIAESKEGYVVKDDIEFGHDNVIPLWAFGLTY